MDQCLKKLSSVYQGCEEEIGELVYQIERMLNEKQLQWDLSYNKLSEDHNQLLEFVSNYKIELKEKDTEITDLKKEIMVIDKSNYEKRIHLESKISELSQPSTGLNVCLKCKEKPFFGQSTSVHEVTIASLKNENDYYQDKIAELEIFQTTHNAQIKLLEEQRSNILRKNEDLKQKFSSYRKEFQTKIKTTDNEIQLFTKQKDQYEATIRDMKDALALKDNEIKNMKNNLEDVLSSNHKNNTLFSNMQKSFDTLNTEKESLVDQVNGLVDQTHLLGQENANLLMKMSATTNDAEFASCNVQNEVELIRAQLGIYQKENDFLRTFIMKQEKTSNPTQHCQVSFLERLEADNYSLKENILNMEQEIANILKLTERCNQPGTMLSPSSTKVEVKQVKEKYEQHLQNMKSEVEQLQLANLSLQVMHHNCSHSETTELDLESNNNSMLLENGVNQSLNTGISSTGSIKSEYCISNVSPGIKNNEKNPFSINESINTTKNNSLTEEFAELQKSVLKKFEAKLNECVSNFNSESGIMSN